MCIYLVISKKALSQDKARAVNIAPAQVWSPGKKIIVIISIAQKAQKVVEFCLYVSVYFIGIILMIHRPTVCSSSLESKAPMFEANNLTSVKAVKVVGAMHLERERKAAGMRER